MKAFIFSLIALLLVTPIVFYALFYLTSLEKESSRSSFKIRAAELASYAESISLDLPRVLEITARRAVISSINHITINATPLDNSTRRILELMLNKTIYNQPSMFMNSSSLNDWANTVKNIGTKSGFTANVTIVSLQIAPYNSYNLNLTAIIAVNMTDLLGEMNFSRFYRRTINLSIQEFEDPLYFLNTRGFLKRNFNFSNEAIYGINKVNTAIAQRLYMNSSDGPSFLDRLEGSLRTSSKYSSLTPLQIGLESFVFIPELSVLGFLIKVNQSSIDYLYFENATNAGSSINGSNYSWFRLGQPHRNIYGVTNSS